MKLLKIKFKAVDSGFDEKVNSRLPYRKLVMHLALGKAKAAAKNIPKPLLSRLIL